VEKGNWGSGEGELGKWRRGTREVEKGN